MAAIILVTMAMLVPYSLALTQTELSQFVSRTHTEQNSNTQGTVTISTTGSNHRLVANGIPDHHTGTFPGTGNPNSITSQNYDVQFPSNPVVAAQPTCLPMGPIAYTKNGVPLYNPFNHLGENAVEGDTAEVFDACDGHPDMRGSYHYHQTPKCVSDGTNEQFIGVAMDGFPIYGSKDSSGNDLTSADLDECHGREDNGQYRYRLTADFPYIMACFKGTPSINQQMLNSADCTIITTTTSSTSTTTSTTSPAGAITQSPTTTSPGGAITQSPTTTSPGGAITQSPTTTSPGGAITQSPGPSTTAVSSTVGGTAAGTRPAAMVSVMVITLCLCLFMG